MVSDWEKEELMRITHSQLKPVRNLAETPLGANAPRLTQQNLKTLKNGAQAEQGVATQTLRGVNHVLGGFFATFAGLFACKKKAVKQCDLYGHILPSGGWSGPMPTCQDCGAQITSPDQVRGASVKTPKAADDQSNSGRRWVK